MCRFVISIFLLLILSLLQGGKSFSIMGLAAPPRQQSFCLLAQDTNNNNNDTNQEYSSSSTPTRKALEQELAALQQQDNNDSKDEAVLLKDDNNRQDRDLFIPVFSIVALAGLFGAYGYEMVRLYSRGELYLPGQ